MDAFSEILSGVKLNGAVFFTAEFSAPWGFSTPASKLMAEKVAPGAPHLVLYHLVIEGGAVVPSPHPRSSTCMPLVMPSPATTASPLSRMLAAIRVKSPFSHSA